MRYSSRSKIINRNRIYIKQLLERNKNSIEHFASAPLRHPTKEERAEIEESRYVWKSGDRFYKLASSFYGQPQLWWILAWYNLAPTEAYIRTGDVIYIPLSLEKILELYDL